MAFNSSNVIYTTGGSLSEVRYCTFFNGRLTSTTKNICN